MRRALILCALLLAVLVMGKCGPASPAGTAPASMPGEVGANLLVQVTGSLGYKHPGWKEYLPLTFGTALRRGDLLRAQAGAEGLVVCSDLTLAPLKPGYEGGLPCSDAKPVLKRGESLVVAPQRSAAEVASIPYVVGPRHTFVKDHFPLLEWAGTAQGGGGYHVRLWGSGLEWQADVEATQVRYPDDAPPLQPGVPYRLSVTDGSGQSSDQEGTALDLSFALLAPDQVTAVEALAGQAEKLELDERAERLVQAEIYADQGLRADAIAVLKEIAATESSPPVHQRLGDLYREIGLYAEAQQAYGQALEGFRAAGDRAGEARVLAGLGLALRGEGDAASARDSLTKAGDLYALLGDAEGASQVAQLLADLGEP
jgi:hypothetical protein